MDEANYFKLLESEIARLNKEIEAERVGISAIKRSDDAEKCRSRLVRLVEESYRSMEILQQNYRKLSPLKDRQSKATDILQDPQHLHDKEI